MEGWRTCISIENQFSIALCSCVQIICSAEKGPIKYHWYEHKANELGPVLGEQIITHGLRQTGNWLTD